MPDYSRLMRNSDHELECEGCRNIGSMLTQHYERKRNGQDAKLVALRTVLHTNFLELESCAKRGCVTCRVFERAIWLRQITKQEAEALRDPQQQDKVWARIPSWPKEDRVDDGSDERVLKITIGTTVRQRQVSNVLFSTRRRLEPINLSCQFLSTNTICEVQKWLKTCRHRHIQCGNLRWSNSNPSNLVEILDGAEHLRLVETSDGPLRRYIAVSYNWGDAEIKSGPDRANIRAHRTTKDKLDAAGNIMIKGNLEQRRQSFPISGLPETIKDVIRLTKSLGIRYVWIDAMCLLPGADWTDEASRMHQVYGNACVTLAVCSSAKTTDGLIQFRGAWQHHGDPCRLGMRYWLTSSDMALDEVRIRSPLFNRAWALQEERLSPRVLYLCGQRLYWSCSESQQIEVGVNKVPRSPSHRSGSFGLRRPQEFLATYHREDISGIHEQWLELIEAYARRSLYDGSDRFPAIAGLAVRYVDLFQENEQVKNQEYLAGLWRQTFAQELAWSMRAAAARPPPHNLWHVAPTWSWVSVPFGSNITTRTPLEPICEFKLLEEANLGKQGQSDAAFDVVKRGALVKSVKVSGPMRRLIQDHAVQKDWSTIAVKSGRDCGRDYRDEYDFRSCIDESVFSRDLTTGRLVVYEPRRQPIIGQLDYLFFPSSPSSSSSHPPLPSSSSSSTSTTAASLGDDAAVASAATSAVASDDDYDDDDEKKRDDQWYKLSDEDLKGLYCLQIGKSTMLLLRRHTTRDGSVVAQNNGEEEEDTIGLGKYRRVGICRNVRSQFLATAVPQSLILI